MYLFDLHCDTVTRLHDGERLAPGDRSLRQNGAHLALGRMACYDWCQCFAIFMPDEYRGEAAVDYFESCYRFFTGQLAENADLAAQAFTAADIREIISGGRCAALLTVEGGSALAGDLGRIARLRECGVRVLTLTWNGKNELGSGMACDEGLTPLGREALPLLEEAGIVVAVSHLSDSGFWEVQKRARRPFIATHSDSRAVCGHGRNLTDDQFRAVAAAGGVVGLNFSTHFLAADDPDPSYAALSAHLGHFLALGGEDAVALGSDYDGTDVPSWLEPAERIGGLYGRVKAEYGEKLAQKLFFQNAMAFFERYDARGEPPCGM